MRQPLSPLPPRSRFTSTGCLADLLEGPLHRAKLASALGLQSCHAFQVYPDRLYPKRSSSYQTLLSQTGSVSAPPLTMDPNLYLDPFLQLPSAHRQKKKNLAKPSTNA